MSSANEVAVEELIRLGEDVSRYATEIKEHNDHWSVFFIPRQRGVRGGGFEIQVGKETGTVARVIRHQ